MRRKSREINIFSMSALDLFASALGAFMLIALISLPYYLKTHQVLMAELRQANARIDRLEEARRQLQQELAQAREELTRSREELARAREDAARMEQELRARQAGLEERIRNLEERIQELDHQLAQCRERVAALEQELRDQGARTRERIAALEQERRALDRELSQCREALNRTFMVVVMKWTTVGHDIDLHVVDPQGNEFFFKQHNRNRAHFPHSPAELSVDLVKGPGVEIWETPQANPGVYRIYFKFYSRPSDSANTAQVSGSIYHRDGALAIRETAMSQVGEKRLVATVTVQADGTVRIQ